jgi:hypothetical protein
VDLPCGFLAECSELQHFDFGPFATSLRRVGDDTLAGCTALATVDTSGLCQVVSIGARFLSRTRIDFLDTSHLGHVEVLGDECLYGVPTVTSFDGFGLTQLREIKSAFLADATGLELINLGSCRQLRRIGKGFGRNAENVKRLELPLALPANDADTNEPLDHRLACSRQRILFDGTPFERTGDPRHPFCAVLMRDLALRAVLRSQGVKVPASRLD